MLSYLGLFTLIASHFEFPILLLWYDMIRYICWPQLGWHPVAVVQHPVAVVQLQVAVVQHPVAVVQHPVAVAQHPVAVAQHPV